MRKCDSPGDAAETVAAGFQRVLAVQVLWMGGGRSDVVVGRSFEVEALD